jgi:chloramphenicol-sensitive protein RarD
VNKGILYAIGAYLLWGVLPVYWKVLEVVPPLQILGHRFVWSLAFLAALLFVRKEIPNFKQSVAAPRTLLIYALSACLLAVNWLTYIWGVNAGFIVETSLGYYINPLLSVLLGVIFLGEKLRPLQWVPIGLAGAGVLYLAVSYGALPWIALVLALSFSLYGLVKKTAPLNSLYGLSLETAIMFIPAIAYLLYVERLGTGAFGRLGATNTVLLALTGVITALPLLMFGSAARRINLSTLGILQYIAPTCQFLLGVLVYGEPFTHARLVGFGIVWVALAIFWLEGAMEQRRVMLQA